MLELELVPELVPELVLVLVLVLGWELVLAPAVNKPPQARRSAQELVQVLKVFFSLFLLLLWVPR